MEVAFARTDSPNAISHGPSHVGGWVGLRSVAQCTRMQSELERFGVRFGASDIEIELLNRIVLFGVQLTCQTRNQKVACTRTFCGHRQIWFLHYSLSHSNCLSSKNAVLTRPPECRLCAKAISIHSSVQQSTRAFGWYLSMVELFRLNVLHPETHTFSHWTLDRARRHCELDLIQAKKINLIVDGRRCFRRRRTVVSQRDTRDFLEYLRGP